MPRHSDVITQPEDMPMDMLPVPAEQIQQNQNLPALSFEIVSQARVPLEATEHAKLIAFRPKDGGVEHIAIVIGEPDLSKAVLTRIHSESFTGDLLGSIGCGFGLQLRGAIAELAQAGSGVILYLAHHARGTGLDEDERIYSPAAQMLKLLGVQSVKLLTNNPIEVTALSRYGVDVAMSR